ncbi:hypothetical protein FT663_05411 [Candidozyma haemuli var. vulneris]|uniref:Uncharacterized protein n=1 Tax=Candidozyma haemuli TaxID=45357 RepID=A0A2V1AZL6_9ASCO|nr:hypothetical protein CXQ85_003797 [[Candida] haemuloni]KAF3985165.1 hypothetical protein FT663_05411 [[Candida] haemuloni var. vulneris]KAF3985434.1 hypothetical protein FT662_05155 [[Candida] haemuloni var. vulneris]PVH23507.1 hypothetical protein CXQ85_003797 [[Candida] haemuloni]
MRLVIFYVLEAPEKVPRADQSSFSYAKLVHRADLQDAIENTNEQVLMVIENNPLREHRKSIKEATESLDCIVAVAVQQTDPIDNFTDEDDMQSYVQIDLESQEAFESFNEECESDKGFYVLEKMDVCKSYSKANQASMVIDLVNICTGKPFFKEDYYGCA